MITLYYRPLPPTNTLTFVPGPSAAWYVLLPYGLGVHLAVRKFIHDTFISLKVY